MAREMKVLFLSVDRGGHALSAYEHRLRRLSNALQANGIQTSRLNLRKPVTRPLLALPLNLPFIAKDIDKYDFVHCGGNAAYVASFLKPFTGARIVADVHGDSCDEARMKWQQRRDAVSAFWIIQAKAMDALMQRASDFFLVVSKPQASRLVQAQIDPSNIALVRNGVDLELFRRKTNDNTKKEFVVCYAGGFQPWQGLGTLLDAAEMIRASNVRLRIIGFSRKDHALKKEISSRLGSKAELINRLSQTDLVSQLSSADILVIPRPRHPAVEVALPTKFSEYAALGKPLIVCDVDETANLVRDNRCGLVSLPNATSLAETISTASQLSQKELHFMGENARALAEREFAWEVIARNYYQRLANWHSGANLVC